MIKLGHMVLKGYKLGTSMIKLGLERSQLGQTIQKSGQMVLKGVSWVYNNKIGSNGLERSQLGTQR